MFVHARIDEGVNDQAILVPQEGVSRNLRGEPTALVVGADNKVEQRTIKTERSIGNSWLVTDGLKAGARVIVQGLQKGRAGLIVTVGEGATPGDRKGGVSGERVRVGWEKWGRQSIKQKNT